MDRQANIEMIVEKEWDMFSQVQNQGGRASCQENPETFGIMRRSQLAGWSDELLASYCADLDAARERGDNLMSLKYAYMMETTYPEDYARIKDSLPIPDAGSLAMIDQIIAVHLGWKEDLNRRYPNLAGRGRAVRSNADSFGWASLETYMRAELKTYSSRTVRLYLEETLARKKDGRNEAEENLLAQVRQYGFDSLDAAEAHLASRS